MAVDNDGDSVEMSKLSTEFPLYHQLQDSARGTTLILVNSMTQNHLVAILHFRERASPPVMAFLMTKPATLSRMVGREPSGGHGAVLQQAGVQKRWDCSGDKTDICWVDLVSFGYGWQQAIQIWLGVL